MKKWLYKVLFFVFIFVGGTLIYIGVRMEDIDEVFRNAVMICLSCIGIQ